MRRIAAFLCACILLFTCACGEGMELHRDETAQTSPAQTSPAQASPEKTSAGPSETAEQLKNEMIIDNDLATVSVDKVVSEGDGIYSFTVSIQNNTGLSVFYTARYYVGGYTLASSTWVMEEGETNTEELYADMISLTDGASSELGEITVNILLETVDSSGSSITVRSIGSAYPTGLTPEKVAYTERPGQDTDIIVIDDESFKVVMTGWDEDDEVSSPAFYVENRTDKYQTISCKDFLINDWLTGEEDVYPAEVSVMPGGYARARAYIYQDSLARYGVETVDKCEFRFQSEEQDTLYTDHSEMYTVWPGAVTEKDYRQKQHKPAADAQVIFDNDELYLTVENVRADDGFILADIYLEHLTDTECCVTADDLIVQGNGIEIPYGLWSQNLTCPCRALALVSISDYDLEEYDLTANDVTELRFDIVYDNYLDEIDTVPVALTLN